jgi:hypothetical protein
MTNKAVTAVLDSIEKKKQARIAAAAANFDKAVEDTDPFDVLDAIAKKPGPKKATSDKPVVVIEDPAVRKALADHLMHADKEKSHKAMKETTKEQAAAALRERFIDLCRERGEALSSITVVAGDVTATFTVPCGYSDIPLDEKPRLEEAFGDDFARYFTRLVKISVKKESAADAGFLRELVEKLGRDFLDRHFDVVRGFNVTPALHDEMTLRPEVAGAARPLVVGQVIKATSPSFRGK